VPIYTSVISVLGKQGSWERAYEVFQEMQKEGLVPDKVLVYTMIRLLEKAKQLDKAALVKQNSMAQGASSASGGDADKWLGGADANGTLQGTAGRNSSAGGTPFFNDLIREGKRSGAFRHAESVADAWLSNEHSVLSAGGITSCISIFSLAGAAQKALDILDIAKRRGVPINQVQYNAIMSACVRCNRPDDALALFGAMRDIGPAGDLSDSAGSAGSGDGESADATAGAVPLSRDMYSYGAALNAYAKKGMWQEALALLRKVESLDRLKPTTVMYNTVINVLGKAKECTLACELYASMFGSLSSPPDKVTHFTIIAALETSGRLKEAAQIRANIRSGNNSSPLLVVAQDSPRTSRVKDAGADTGAGTDADEEDEEDESMAVKVVDSMQDLPDDISLSPAGTLRDKLLAAGRRPTATAGGTSTGAKYKWEKGGGGAVQLLKVMGATGQAAQAEDLLKELERDNGGQPLPTSLYNAAIAACGASSDWKRAVSVYSSMGGKIPRDMQTYKIMLPLLEAAAVASEDAGTALKLVTARGQLEGLRM
jgi:pentatricopeptide repeat protein